MARGILNDKEANKRRGKCRVVSVYNRKGGVGKTVATLNIAGWLAKGYRDPKTRLPIISRSKVLIVDYDNQNNLSKMALCHCDKYREFPVTLFDLLLLLDKLFYGHDVEDEYRKKERLTPYEQRQLNLIEERKKMIDFDNFNMEDVIYDAYRGRRTKEIVEILDDDRTFVTYNVDVIPNLHDADYSYFKSTVDDAISVIMHLAKKQYAYDYIFIDCPPASSILMETALRISDFMLVPTEDTESGIDGVDFCWEMLMSLKKTNDEEYKSYCNFLGVFLNNINEKESKTAEGVRNLLEAEYEDYFIKNTIRMDINNMKLVQDDGIPICYYKPQCRLAIDYKNLVIELISRMNRMEV